MKTQTLRAASMLILTFVLGSVCVSAQAGKFEVPNKPIISQAPIIEWKNNERKQVNGKTMVDLVFSVTNWEAFPDAIFAASPDLPACGENKSAALTWTQILDYKTGKGYGGNCNMKKSEEMKSVTMNAVESDKMPECIYFTLYNRKTKKILESNPIRFLGGDSKQCKK